MSEANLREALLQQNGHSALDQELGRLRALVAAEQRRARRLTFWALAIWIIWIPMILLSFGMPYFLAKSNHPPLPPTTQTTTAPAPAAQQPPQASRHSAEGIFPAIIGLLLVAAFFTLPIVGIVLTIMMILARRSASMGLIRSSLASIDAQLRLLAINQERKSQS